MSKIINLLNYERKNSKTHEKDELVELDVNFFMKKLTSSKYQNTKELLKVCRENI